MAGTAKTRLQPELGLEGAADLYRAFILDTHAKASTLGIAVRWYVTPSVAEFPELPGHQTRHLQTGADLGMRLEHAFLESVDAGFGPLVVIGTDSPTLPTDALTDAFSLLSSNPSAVIGPADDGGYYLLGLRDVAPDFFPRIEYSMANVAQRTGDELRTKGVLCSTLLSWYDIDTGVDLQRLIDELREFPERAPETAKWLREAGHLA